MDGEDLFPHEFGFWLQQRRETMNWTTTDLAEKIGVSHGAVWKWEQNNSLPTYDRIPLIANAFGISEFEVYCAIRGIDYRQQADGTLMALLNITPADSQMLLRLAAHLMPVLRQFAGELSGELANAGVVTSGSAVSVAASQANVAVFQTVMEEAMNGKQMHAQGGRGSVEKEQGEREVTRGAARRRAKRKNDLPHSDLPMVKDAG